MQKTKILEDLWKGELYPFEQNSVQNRKLSESLLISRKAFNDCLTDEQKRLFEEYESANDSICFEAEKNAFIYGFQMGMKMLLSALDD